MVGKKGLRADTNIESGGRDSDGCALEIVPANGLLPASDGSGLGVGDGPGVGDGFRV